MYITCFTEFSNQIYMLLCSTSTCSPNAQLNISTKWKDTQHRDPILSEEMPWLRPLLVKCQNRVNQQNSVILCHPSILPITVPDWTLYPPDMYNALASMKMCTMICYAYKLTASINCIHWAMDVKKEEVIATIVTQAGICKETPH